MRSVNDLLVGEFVLYDLEYTSWPGSKESSWTRPGEHREIVEIGAVRLNRNGSELMAVTEFSCLVRPSINPSLSDYFINLTGITQTELDQHGMPFVEAWETFGAFAGNGICLLSFGEDDEIVRENHVLNSSSAHSEKGQFLDYRAMLCHELGIPESTCSADLPGTIGIETSFQKHRALGDVYAQLSVLRYLVGKSRT